MPAEQLASALDTNVEVGSPALQRSVFASCHDWGSIWIMCVRTFASWGAALIWITQDSSHVQLFVCDCVHICCTLIAQVFHNQGQAALCFNALLSPM